MGTTRVIGGRSGRVLRDPDGALPALTSLARGTIGTNNSEVTAVSQQALAVSEGVVNAAADKGPENA